MIGATVAALMRLCRERLARDDLRRVAQAGARAGLREDHGADVARAIDTTAESQTRFHEWRGALASAGDVEPGAAERYLLLVSAERALPWIAALPVGASVKARFYDAFRRCATLAPSEDPELFAAGSARFAIACKIATLRRFPAGEFDWEVSGIPRSWMARVDRRDLARVLGTILFRLRGFSPTFVSHLGLFRPTRSMSEEENNRSFFRMAEAMALQPRIRGWSGSSWMRAPATHVVSPNLAWMNRTLLENGAVVTTIGSADPEGGVLAHSETRRAAYAAGQFTPMVGFGVWPRRALLDWARRHPELADPPPAP